MGMFDSLASVAAGAATGGASTALTSGGGMSLGGGTSSADSGDNTFANDFNYKTGAVIPAVNYTQLAIIGGVVLVGLVLLMKKK